MAVVYRVDLEDTAGDVIAIFKSFIALRVEASWLERGNYQFTISGYDTRYRLFQPDYLIRVWMRDLDEGIDWINVFTGIHKSFAKALYQDGSRTWTSYGVDENELLDKEYILWPSGEPQAQKSGIVSTVMLEFVDENIGALALASGGRDLDGQVIGLVLAADPVVGPAWSGARARKNLLGVLRELAKFAAQAGDDVDYRVISTPGYTWLFECGKLGTDRTNVGLNTATGLNAAGNVPVVFGEQFGNISSLTRSESRTNAFNSVVSLGQGPGTSRATGAAVDAAEVALSSVARRSTVINAVNNGASDLNDVADAALQALLPKQKISFSPYKAAQVFFRDYFLGDWVTAVDDGIEFNKRIIGYTLSVGEDNPEDITVEFEDV